MTLDSSSPMPAPARSLQTRTGLDTGKAASAMTMLVLKGVVAQRPGNAFELKRTRPGSGTAK
jgi:hypothetical protein